jgi:hypothetical protein
MQKIFYLCLMLVGLLSSPGASAEVSVNIGINLPLYPNLIQVPGYPVYYAPEVEANFFFYDGMYWVYQDDVWYTSSWYNGPWWQVAPEDVPLFVLRVPVYYYRQPPVFFNGWQSDAAPRWDEHWGRDWHRSGWDRWNRNAVPTPAPLPVYQRLYSGERYPQQLQQQKLQQQHYRFQPHDPIARHYDQPPQVYSGQKKIPDERGVRQQTAPHVQRATPEVPRHESPQMQSPVPVQYEHRQEERQPGRGAPHEPGQEHRRDRNN